MFGDIKVVFNNKSEDIFDLKIVTIYLPFPQVYFHVNDNNYTI